MNNLETVYREGRLIRRAWSSVDNGRQLLCWLTALAGDPETRPETCSAHLCPPWLAYWLPWADDSGTAEAWPRHVERLIRVAPLLGDINPEQSRRLDLLFRREALLVARDSAGSSVAVVDRVLALIDRALAGADLTKDEWAAAAARWADADAAAARWAAADAADRIISACLGHLEREVAP